MENSTIRSYKKYIVRQIAINVVGLVRTHINDRINQGYLSYKIPFTILYIYLDYET